jgi:hypothetical protein
MALRTAAVAGLCGVALLAARVAEATGVLDDGALGELASRLDVAASVLIVVVLAAAWRPLVAGRLTGPAHAGWTWTSYRTFLVRWLAPLYALWIPVVVLNG